MSLSSYSKASFALIPPDNTDYDPHSLPPYLSPLELQNLIETSEDKNQTRRTPCLSSKTLLPHCTLPIYQLNYLVPGVSLTKETRGNTWTIFCPQIGRSCRSLSPFYHLKMSQAIPAIPSLPTMMISSIYSSSWLSSCPFSTSNSSHENLILSYGNTPLPLLKPDEICCLCCSKSGHLLEGCEHNYWWNKALD